MSEKALARCPKVYHPMGLHCWLRSVIEGRAARCAWCGEQIDPVELGDPPVKAPRERRRASEVDAAQTAMEFDGGAEA